MKNIVVAAVEAALSEVMDRPVSDLSDEMKLDRDFDLDSFMFVQFLLSLEDKVGNLRFDPMSFGQVDLNSVGTLVEYILAQTHEGVR
ncbi:acyl carrier protein (plasmid) [Rhizobium sp. NIBRBAC000502774]|nr:acyl carrier protein [Rhizobium sp. NIBRBAC000502774]